MDQWLGRMVSSGVTVNGSMKTYLRTALIHLTSFNVFGCLGIILLTSCMVIPVGKDDFSVLGNDYFSNLIRENGGRFRVNKKIKQLSRDFFLGKTSQEIKEIFAQAQGGCESGLQSDMLTCDVTRRWQMKRISHPGVEQTIDKTFVPGVRLLYCFTLSEGNSVIDVDLELEDLTLLYDQEIPRCFVPSAEADKYEVACWQSVEDYGDAVAYEIFLKRYPHGEFADLAYQKLKQLRDQGDGKSTTDAAKDWKVVPRKKPCIKAFVATTAPPVEMVSVPGGCFQMGDNFNEELYGEKPVHEVCVSDFQLARYEVTQGQWKAVMGSNTSYFKDCGTDCPVERVSWEDAQEFIEKLNQLTGKTYRLPTEAEWEYAARSGGNKEKYAGENEKSSLDRVAWYAQNSGHRTHKVGLKSPNGLGLYDMSGNVWEWCSDWYDKHYYENSPKFNPQGPANGKYRVSRGGEMGTVPWYLRTANRLMLLPDEGSNGQGVRLALPSGQ